MMACREQAETPERGSREPVGIGDNTPPLLYKSFFENLTNRKAREHASFAVAAKGE